MTGGRSRKAFGVHRLVSRCLECSFDSVRRLRSNALAEVAWMTPESGGYTVFTTRLCMMRNAWCVIHQIPLRTVGWSNSPGESIRDLFSASEHSQGGAQRSEQYLYGAQRAIQWRSDSREGGQQFTKRIAGALESATASTHFREATSESKDVYLFTLPVLEL